MSRHKTPADKAKWAAYMRDYRKAHPGSDVRPDTLPPTPRQIEILRAYADPVRGGSQERVAEMLGISKSAVHNQLQRLMRRLQVHEPSQAVMKLWVMNSEQGDPTDDGPLPERKRRLHR